MNRRSSLGIPKEELEIIFKTFAGYFSESWLNKTGRHALQILWKRKDELATNELFSLAVALNTLMNIDPRWTNNQLKNIKSSDSKVSQGAIFEVLALNILHNNNHTIKPAKLNQAGFDGVMKVGEKEIRVSIKNYGISLAQKNFENQAKVIEELAKKLLVKYDYPPVTIIIDCPNYPEDSDWQFLKENLDRIFESKRFNADPVCALASVPKDDAEVNNLENAEIEWVVRISPFTQNIEDYHSAYKTYSLVVSTPFHKNESDNLYSKINEACFNLSKHSTFENKDLINALVIHVPVTASMENCRKWVEDGNRKKRNCEG